MDTPVKCDFALSLPEVSPIREVLAKLIREYQAAFDSVTEQLKLIPEKGSVCIRNIKGHQYYYLIYRSASKRFQADYLGKEDPMELRQKINARRILKRELKKITEALYLLGAKVKQPHRNFSLALRFFVLNRDKFTCRYCGRSVEKHGVVLQVDHVVPKKLGGSDKVANLVTACFDCNHRKCARTIEG
jgi:hypothetical protein